MGPICTPASPPQYPRWLLGPPGSLCAQRSGCPCCLYLLPSLSCLWLLRVHVCVRMCACARVFSSVLASHEVFIECQGPPLSSRGRVSWCRSCFSGGLCASLCPQIATSPRQSGRLRLCASLVHFCPCLFAGPVWVSPFPSARPCPSGTHWVSAGPSLPRVPGHPPAPAHSVTASLTPLEPLPAPAAGDVLASRGPCLAASALSQPECQEWGRALAVPLL